MVGGGNNTPTLPEFTITQLNLIDQPGEGGGTLMTASADIINPYPVTIDVPGLAWKVLVPGCNPSERIRLTDANTGAFLIRSGKNITVNVSSLISSLPTKLLDPCKGGTSSPLEVLFQSFINSTQNTTIFISGSHQTAPHLPKWLPAILSSLTIPFPLPHLGTNTSDLISTIHCSEMKVTFPSPWAPPGTPAAQPKVSGIVEAIIRPPKQADHISINITAVKTDVDLLDEGEKFGRIVVPEWVPATTTRNNTLIHVKTRVKEIPIEVLDPFVFQRVMTKILRGVGVVEIGVEGTVDAQVNILIGEFVVRGVPVEGIVEVQGISPYHDLKLGLVGDIDVLSTTRDSITLTSTVQVNNPTEYEAFVPYLNLHLLYEGYCLSESCVDYRHLIGNATAINATVSNGTNKISGIVTYAPSTAADIPYAEKFLGEYLSGIPPRLQR